MKPIRSFRTICRDYGLNLSQTHTLQSLVNQHEGTLHPYWIQLALNMSYDPIKRLHDELIANEWAVPDEIRIEGVMYESELSDIEIEIIALIELFQEAEPYRINAL